MAAVRPSGRPALSAHCPLPVLHRQTEDGACSRTTLCSRGAQTGGTRASLREKVIRRRSTGRPGPRPWSALAVTSLCPHQSPRVRVPHRKGSSTARPLPTAISVPGARVVERPRQPGPGVRRGCTLQGAGVESPSRSSPAHRSHPPAEPAVTPRPSPDLTDGPSGLAAASTTRARLVERAPPCFGMHASAQRLLAPAARLHLPPLARPRAQVATLSGPTRAAVGPSSTIHGALQNTRGRGDVHGQDPADLGKRQSGLSAQTQTQTQTRTQAQARLLPLARFLSSSCAPSLLRHPLKTPLSSPPLPPSLPPPPDHHLRRPSAPVCRPPPAHCRPAEQSTRPPCTANGTPTGAARTPPPTRTAHSTRPPPPPPTPSPTRHPTPTRARTRQTSTPPPPHPP
ncbi:hypothetical protein BC628DRAFT_209314 [Trametes gibbosa]|nr:hypothetical protein BC628DRAFT_209314 [Trametes gibbosa]